ncbi:hypothetical protein GJ744_009853 [Endocarpon pusillum]|uniref:BHLH domain-containing protein n=1 Tax=Endocarpon pusillum TaxID=364733 RepID=A0A8H7E5W4_9EURO|nr:hypothetical protein GJ744_009853 [Endocarpon pusillum]
MNQDSTTAWHQPLQDDPMLVAGDDDDDFSNFLQLGIDFPGFDETQTGHHGFDTPMGDLGMEQLAMGSSVEDLRGHTVPIGTCLSNPGRDDLIHQYAKISDGPGLEFRAPAIQHQQVQQHHQQHHRKHDVQSSTYEPRIMVPPTPQSSEMQGAAARYYHYVDGDGLSEFDPYQRHRTDQMTFTPLVSPAVTPIDPNLCFPDSTTRGEYFSPLTSPSIEAQNGHPRRKIRLQITTPKRGSVTSPVDQSVETPSVPNSARGASRKDSRKLSVSGRASGRTVRQSPLIKPHGRRKQTSLNISPAGLTELAEHSQISNAYAAEASPNLRARSTNSDGSGQSSISPEPLSEALMPPPSLPRSAGKSPNIVGKNQSPITANEPATPATLMRLPNKVSSPPMRNQGSGRIFVPNNELMEDIMLPESATTTTLLPLTIDTTRSVADDEVTPTLSAKTPKLSANSTPRTSVATAQVRSPSDVTHKRTESRAGNSMKARQAGAPSHVSPAIRPKISPSINPLVPHSNPGTPAISAETSALYLASKSNYQNILEGTHLPGVSYPEALAENLSSKRTSHKLAEQGRRNRINVALKEMESLLPPTPATRGKRDRSGSIDGDSGDKAAAAGNSKASTVELAIAYIRSLQAELSETKAKLEDQEKKLEDREKKLAEVNSSGDNASASPQ